MNLQNPNLNEFEKEVMAQLADCSPAEQIAILKTTAEAETNEHIRRDIQNLLVKLSAR